MLTIFICEDDPHYQDFLYNCIKDLVSWDESDIEIAKPTNDPAKIIGCIKDRKVYGLYFLDIELGGGYNGIEVAKEIRQHDPRGFIVFVTSHQRYMNLTFEYKVEALGYIKKTKSEKIFREEISKCIEDAQKRHTTRIEDNCYIFKTQGGQRVSCEHEDILFIQSDSIDARRVIIHTKKRQYTTYISLDKLSKTLPSRIFFRCHRSCILNMDNIPKRDGAIIFNENNNITMQNGAECLISVRKKRGLIRLASDMMLT